ncbi:ABC transporter ATP-binding protein [Treponema primitia]|uniref:ABC transporter ATP-binding protein n=1 Tax=Treponema primitia TaxID=88058 RepID=UPI003980814F
MNTSVIELNNITKIFDGKEVVKDVSLKIADGEFLTLLGPSGCGKTTILRMIGGFISPDRGEIILHGQNVVGVPANKREVSTVFQGYALFPHLTVRDNVGFGLRMKKVPKQEIREQVEEILELTDLTPFINRKPHQLSGGQQQRVAIARCLVTKPKLMLFDEPLGALDLKLRRQMQLELKKTQKSLGITYVYVTHDQEEALTMSDRIVVMNQGKVEQAGAPGEVYAFPETRFVADFLGESNLFSGTCKISGDQTFFETEGVTIPVPPQKKAPLCISIRPEYLKIVPADEVMAGFAGIVEKVIFLGQVYRYDVKLSSGKIVQVLAEAGNFSAGTKVLLAWENDKISIIHDKEK